MARIITMLRITTAELPGRRTVEQRRGQGAPKMLDESNWTTCSGLMAPIPLPAFAGVRLMPDSTWNRAKKNGIWMSIGRQAENGFVPCFLYMAICS